MIKNCDYKKRTEKIINALKKNKIDALVALSLENVYYFTGAYIMTQRDLPDRLEIPVFSENSDPLFIVCKIEESLVRKESWIKDVRAYIEFQESPIQFLVEALIELGLKEGHIGIEKNYITSLHFEELNNGLPKAEFINCRDIFEEVRMIKDRGEIEILAKGAKATRKAVDAAFITAKPGDTERQLANQVTINLLNQGADKLDFICLGTGYRSQLAHPTPNDIPLISGDILKIDFGGVFSGYLSDLARTAVIGKPSLKQYDIYKKLREIQKEVIGYMKIGVRLCDIYQKCKDLFEKKGKLPFDMPHVGHGLGISAHERPLINPISEDVLQENMVINVEPLVILKDYGYHVEDLVLITKNGAKILTGSDLSQDIPKIS